MPLKSDSSDQSLNVQRRLVSAIASKNIRLTPQAITSLIQTLSVSSSSEILGCTDTLLAGLLLSGSYTVDILETAGVNPLALSRQALESVRSAIPGTHYIADSIEFLLRSEALASAIETAATDGGILETSHLLEAAISPAVAEHWAETFPIEDRSDPRPHSHLLIELENGMCSVLEHLTDIITGYKRLSRKTLRTRRHSITKREDELLDKTLGQDFRDLQTEELEFGIAALNQWFLHRRILTDPSNLCLRLIHRLENGLLFGPELFMEADGDLKAVHVGLRNAKKYSPERDLPSLALFMRNGRIHVGQYTYRNAFTVETAASSGLLSTVHLQALRPVPLLSQMLLTQFEELISQENLREHEIQRFLVSFPELLHSLGYTSARPHICLRSEEHDRLIPDFIVELPGGRGFDILDLKLPTSRLTAGSPYLRVSSELTKAVAQLRKYRACFDESVYRKAFEKKYGLVAFKPELIIVMGRDTEFGSRDDRLEIESQLAAGIRLVTYDELIAYGRSRSILEL